MPRPYVKLSFQRPIFHSMRGEILPKLFLHHRFVIGPVADVHFGNGVTFEDDRVGENPVWGSTVAIGYQEAHLFAGLEELEVAKTQDKYNVKPDRLSAPERDV
jgi:hypothetical protein